MRILSGNIRFTFQTMNINTISTRFKSKDTKIIQILYYNLEFLFNRNFNESSFLNLVCKSEIIIITTFSTIASVSACTSTYNRCGKNYVKTKIIISKKKILYERKAKTDKYNLFIENHDFNV